MLSRPLHRAAAAPALLLWFAVNPGCAQIAGITDSAPQTCTNGVKDADEEDIDCGGVCVGGCKGAKCAGPGDCASGRCGKTTGTCEEATCEDGVLNGGETHVDCGSAACGKCDGDACSGNKDCHSERCIGGQCRPKTCFDGQKNGDEHDVDCGGSCQACDGESCSTPGDCLNRVCLEGKCRPLTCFNSTLDGHETQNDCGGSDCLACNNDPCTRSTMCASENCNLLKQQCECSHCAAFLNPALPPALVTVCLQSATLLGNLIKCGCAGNCASACNSCSKYNTDLQVEACSNCIKSQSGCLTEANLCIADK